MAEAKADPEQAPVPAPPAAPVPAPRRFLVEGPKGAWEFLAVSDGHARHLYRNETALAPELAAGLVVTELE